MKAGYEYAVTDFFFDNLSQAKHGDVIHGITVLRFDDHYQPIGVTNELKRAQNLGMHHQDRHTVAGLVKYHKDADIWVQVLAIMDGGEI